MSYNPAAMNRDVSAHGSLASTMGRLHVSDE